MGNKGRFGGKKNFDIHSFRIFFKTLTKDLLNIIDSLTKPKLKVALISYYYENPSPGGAGIHVQNLARYLHKSGCEVHVFCSSDYDETYKEDGVIVHCQQRLVGPLETDLQKKILKYDIFESQVIRDIVRENSKRKFDIVHTHARHSKPGFMLKKVCAIKWVHTFHAIEKVRWSKLSNEEKLFQDLHEWEESVVNFCDGAIFVSEALMREGCKHYNIKSKRVIYNGVDTEFFSYSPIRNPNVLFIGRFSLEKGIKKLPDIITRLMETKNATFTAVCPMGAQTDELKGIRDKLRELEKEFGGRVKILEKAQNRERIKELYQHCQVYIQPSKYESFGLCIIEAMATGRPVVAFNVGGIPEVIGDCGYVVNGKEEFIGAVTELMRDKKTCIAMGDKASKRAKSFDWNVLSKKTIEYYKEVLT